MNQEQLILERLDSLENRIAPLAESARAFGELRDEIAPRVNEAVQALIVQLADVDSDFQLEDLLYLTKKMLRNVNNFNFSLDQLKNMIDFALTAEPLLKATVPQIIFFLDDLEKKGVFRIMQASVEVLKKIGETYTAEDMEQMGDGLVRLLGLMKKISSPQALSFLDKAAELPARVDCSRTKAVGPFGLLCALGNPQIKQGIGALMEITKAMAVFSSITTCSTSPLGEAVLSEGNS